jgi:tetratricopeptide (TPR) repeat protein
MLSPTLVILCSLQDNKLKSTSEYGLALQRIGQVHLQFGRYADAERCFLDSLAPREKGLGELGARVMLAQTYASMSRWKSALSVIEPVIDSLRQAPNSDFDPRELADALWLESAICREMGQFEKAKESCSEACLILEFILERNHPTTLICECSLYAIEVARHEVSEALLVLPRNLDLLGGLLGRESVHLISPHATYAELHSLVANKITSIRNTFLEKSRRILTIDVWNSLNACGLQKIATEVESFFSESISRDEFSEYMGDVVREHRLLARNSYQAAIDITASNFGPNHPDLIELYQRLGTICGQLGKHKRSALCFRKADAIRDA